MVCVLCCVVLSNEVLYDEVLYGAMCDDVVLCGIVFVVLCNVI